MKNKKNIYILLPAVLIIWGLLIYKVVRGIKPSSPNVTIPETTQAYNLKSIKEPEPFTIKADYRDPFLGTMEKKKEVKTTKPKAPIVKKEQQPFPTIVYKGVVSPKGNGDEVFMILVNTQQYLFKKNEIHGNVKLIKGDNERVVLRFQNQQQTFLLVK